MASLLQVGHCTAGCSLLPLPPVSCLLPPASCLLPPVSCPLQAGQQLAQQMQQSNPELVEQLRRQMGGQEDGKYCSLALSLLGGGGPFPPPPGNPPQ